MYAVAGVSGRTGAVAAEALLARGEKVRVLVRDAGKGESWKARGAEVAVADLSDQASLVAALRGVKGAWFLIPGDFASADPVTLGIQRGRNLAAAAKAAGLPHVVLLSSVGAQHPDGTGPIKLLHATEAALRDAGVPTTAVRASYFVENWASVLPVAKSDGILPSFVAADLALPQVCTADIGRLAAELLVEGPRGQRVIGLAGPVDVTPQTVAETVGKLLGRPIQLVTPPLAAAAPALQQAGVLGPWAELYAEMYRGIASGLVAFGPEPIRRGTTSLEDTLRALLG